MSFKLNKGKEVRRSRPDKKVLWICAVIGAAANTGFTVYLAYLTNAPTFGDSILNVLIGLSRLDMFVHVLVQAAMGFAVGFLFGLLVVFAFDLNNPEDHTDHYKIH